MLRLSKGVAHPRRLPGAVMLSAALHVIFVGVWFYVSEHTSSIPRAVPTNASTTVVMKVSPRIVFIPTKPVPSKKPPAPVMPDVLTARPRAKAEPPAQVVTGVFPTASPPTARGDAGRIEVGMFGRGSGQVRLTSGSGVGESGHVVIGAFGRGGPVGAPSGAGGTVGPTDVFTPSGPPRTQVAPVAQEAVDEKAQLLSAPTPSYNEEARRLHVTGDVLLEVKLTKSGEVRVLRVLSGLGHGLDQLAIDAANRTRCRPALKGGRPVDVLATITVGFKLT